MFTSLLSSTGLKLAIAGIALAAAFFGGIHLRGEIDAGQMEKQTLQYQQAIDAANQIAATEQQKIDADALAASDAQAQVLVKQNATLQAELADVSNHVHSQPMPCITYGLVRVLDAAILGTAAGNLALPAGKSDDACSPITADDMARTITSNYANANANAQQLNALIGLVKQIQADRNAAIKAQKTP